MIPINIDISETVNEFVLSEDEVKSLSAYLLDRVATEFTMRWEEQIDQNLKSTRGEYKKGIFQEQNTDDGSITIGLTPRQSPMALKIEDGSDPYDMKEGFANSDKRKPSYRKNGTTGWYLTIPFRFATAEAIGESSVFSGNLPKPIQNIVKVAVEPLKFSQIPTQFQAMGQNMISGYKHKFNIYEGLQRVETGSGTEKRGAYMNFRRVSDLSDAAAWIHPGFEAKRLMEAAIQQTDFPAVVDDAINEFLNNR